VKASAFRRWPVTLGLIALVQTTRWTGGHDLIDFIDLSYVYQVLYLCYNQYMKIFRKDIL